MSLSNKLEKIIQRYDELTDKMMDPSSLSQQDFAKIAKERSMLEDVVSLAKDYISTEESLKQAEEILADNEADQEFKELAEEEKKENSQAMKALEERLKVALLPKDEDDNKNAILEVRAGTGGEEAALFCAVLLRMYHRFADKKGWKFDIISISETGLDGCKEASVSISGKDVFANMKFESGVHRVQRVPETESSGRIHTSAATVAVLPEAEEVDLHIEDKDLKIDVYRASGAGGQHVNTTDSAVRITHIPTGVVVCQQDEKSQHKNKSKAMKILRSRIYESERAKRDADRSEMRKGQIGSGDRSERIRTYNYPQSRITDHRINMTKYNLEEVTLEGNLDEFVKALIAEEQAEKLSESNL